jgi:hypothetical protein
MGKLVAERWPTVPSVLERVTPGLRIWSGRVDPCFAGSGAPNSNAAVEWLNASPGRSSGSYARQRSMIESTSSPRELTPVNGCCTVRVRSLARVVPNTSCSLVRIAAPRGIGS